MAEHAGYGRSSIVAIEGDLPRELELQIQRTANVRGKVMRGGAPLGPFPALETARRALAAHLSARMAATV